MKADRNWKGIMEKLDEIFESPSFDIKVVLQFLGEELDGHWVAYWKVDSNVGQLIFSDAWKAPSLQAEKFEDDVRRRRFSLGEGMPGKTWRLKVPQKSTDIARDMMLPRSLEAYSSGLREGVWFVVERDNSICGIIEILRERPTSNGPQVISMLEKLGKRLGHYLCTAV